MTGNLPLVPDHELFGVIGRGAFGEVWLARNVMGIWRAVKVIRRSDFTHRESYEREFEAIQRYEPVARSTEGLVQILHVGRNDGQGYFYYVMELSDDAGEAEEKMGKGETGQTPSDPFSPANYRPHTLRSELARGGSLDLHEALAIATALARGLVHLHAQSLVHRDIKPSNVIFVHGRARLADMGLVEREGHPSFIGTEGYIAPEGSGTPAADLYSLGLVLYEMATGCDRKQFPQLPPEWLSQGDPTRWELHEVILRACEGMPERRYRTAAELEADLAVISSGQSVRERGVLARRSRRLKITGAIATVGFVIASGWALLSIQRATMDNDARVQAERLRAQTELALVESHLAQAAANRQTGRTGQRYETLARIEEALARLRRLATNSVAPLSAARQAEFTGAARNEAIAALTRVDLREIGRWPAAFDRQWGMAVDAELRRLAVAGPSNTVRIVVAPGGLKQGELPAGPAEIEQVGPFSPDGHYLMVRYKNAENWIWNLDNQQVLFRQESQGIHLRAVFRRRGVLVPVQGGGLVWHSLTNSSVIRNYPTSEQLMWLIPAADDEHLVGFTRWFMEACWLGGEPLHELKRRPLPRGTDMGDFAINRDGRYLAISIMIGQVPLLDFAEPDVPPTLLAGHAAEIVAAAFHPDGRHLVTSSWDGTTRIWDWRAGQARLVHDRWTSALRFSADGSRCAFIVGDFPQAEILFCEVATPGFVRQWHSDALKTNEPLKKIPVRATFSPDSRWLALGTAYGVRLLTVPELDPRYALGSNEVYAVRFASQGNRLFTAGEDGQRMWELALPMVTSLDDKPQTAPADFVASHSHTPGHERQLTLGPDGQPLAVLRGHRAFHRAGVPPKWWPVREPGEHESMATSRDGSWMAISGANHVCLLRLTDGEKIWQSSMRGHGCFDFSPDGRRFVALDADGLRGFDAASGEVRWRLPRTDVYLRVGEIAFSEDGRWIAAPLVRRDVSLIQAATGQVAARLTNPSQASVVSTSFSPDGRYLAVTLADQSVQLWDLHALRKELVKFGLDWEEN